MYGTVATCSPSIIKTYTWPTKGNTDMAFIDTVINNLCCGHA